MAAQQQKPLDRARAARRYTELEHLIAIGACTEDDEDGTLWYEDMDISTEIDSLEARAAGEDLRFVATRIDTKGRRVYELEELTKEERMERATQYDAIRRAGIAALFHWEDRNKIVLDQGGYVVGKLPGDGAPAYVVRIDAEVRENDPMMTYSWEEHEDLVVTWNEGGEAVIDDATEEQLALIRAAEEAHSDAAGAIREWARASFTPISAETDDGTGPVRVDLLRLERGKGERWEALLAIAGGRFNLRVVFTLEGPGRVAVESQTQEFPEETAQ